MAQNPVRPGMFNKDRLNIKLAKLNLMNNRKSGEGLE